MHYFREDLLEKPDIKVNVAIRKHLMCLNESDLNPLQSLSKQLKETIEKVELNRYLSPITDTLKKNLAEYIGHDVKENQILFGNGVDDMLYFIFTATRDQNESYVLSLAPSYFDYITYSGCVGLKMVFLDFDDNFDFNTDIYLEKLNHPSCKLGILCNPNNPTGHLLPDEKIVSILSATDKPILLDETYFEFSDKTFVHRFKEFPNLIITRSFSKSFSAAGLRFGYIISTEENIKYLSKVIPYFNTSILTQAIANTILENQEIFFENNRFIKAEKVKMFEEMSKYREVKVYPSATNFLAFSLGENTSQFYEYLLENDISTRNIGGHPLLRNHLRVTISKIESNTAFLNSLKSFIENQH